MIKGNNKYKGINGKHIIKWALLTTPMLLFISMFFMGGGHGTYFFGKLFYPISMIIAGIKGEITDLALFLAVFQIPTYGLLIYISRKNHWKLVSMTIIFVHIILWIICMNTASNFD